MNTTTHNGITHSEMVCRLVKSSQQLLDEMTPFKAGIMHAAIGIAGEGGEILDSVKKHIVYNQPIDEPLKPGGQTIRENIKEELGDLEFYMEDLRQRFNITREETLKLNMEKLAKRYGDDYGYSNVKAGARADKEPDVDAMIANARTERLDAAANFANTSASFSAGGES